MSNLTTRKIVLGTLMTLVLAFSVQGIADALTFGTSRTGDLQTVRVNDDFSITFRPDLVGPVDVNDSDPSKARHRKASTTDIANAPRTDSDPDSITSNFTVTKDEDYEKTNDTHYYIVTTTSSVSNTAGSANVTKTLHTRYWATEAEAYYYNTEQVTIAVTTGDATLKKVGKYDAPSDGVLTETGKDGRKLLDSSMTLTFTAPSSGMKQIITISDTTDPNNDTDTGDYPVGVTTANPLTFTVYVVIPAQSLSSPATALAESTDSVYYAYKDAEHRVDSAFGFTPEHAPVYYSVQGSGSLYVGEGTRRLRLPNGKLTSSSADVYLRGHTATSRITASVAGTTPHTVIYIYIDPSQEARYPHLEITNGNDDQRGASGGRLEEYLGVKVTDGRGSPVSGVAVEFKVDANVTGAMFIPVPGTMVYVTNAGVLADSVSDPVNGDVYAATSTVPREKISPVFVQTDRGGLAKVYYEMGTGEIQTITASLEGVPSSPFVSKDFTFRVGTTGSERVANLEILSGNPQSAAKGKNTSPLVVIARSTANYRIPNVVIQFRSSIGILSREGLTDAPLENGHDDDSDGTSLQWGEVPVNTPNPDTGQQIYVITGSDGQASVTYNVGQFVIAREITAEIRHEPLDSDYSFSIDRVTFNINGGGTPSRLPADEDEDEDVPSVTVDVPSTVTGPAGGTATLTITASASATVTVGGLGDNFPLANVGTQTQSGTTYTRTLTLPNQVASYSLTVFVGNTSYPVNVNVTAATAQAGTLTVRIDPFSGAPGTTATVTVTATDSSAQSANVTVNLTATGGTLSSPSVATGTTGTNTVTLTRGSTVGTENYVTVSGPSGYDSKRGRYIIAGPAVRDTTVGAAEELDVYDGNNQNGSLNSPLAEPFIVEVVDANDNPVEDARVRFRTTIGSGRFSPRTPRTDEDGFAETTFTPTSPGRIRVVATVAGADSTAAFIVQGGEPADALVKVSGDDQSGTPGNALANPFVVEVQDEDGEPLSGHSVTFSVTAGGGSLSETSATTNANGRAQTTLTLGSAPGVNSVQASVSGVDPVTFSTNIEPKIRVAAANRPVMYWIDSGMLYSLAGAKAAKIAESANGVAVSGGKIYWTSQINANSGTINSANLDGSRMRQQCLPQFRVCR